MLEGVRLPPIIVLAATLRVITVVVILAGANPFLMATHLVVGDGVDGWDEKDGKGRMCRCGGGEYGIQVGPQKAYTHTHLKDTAGSHLVGTGSQGSRQQY